jgi:hypothetical protein
MTENNTQAAECLSHLTAELGTFTAEEIDLLRQWFNCVQDLNPRYLAKNDFVLASKIYENLYLRVPDSIIEVVKKGEIKLKDGEWYWVRYDALGKNNEAPALYKADVDCFYSYEFSGIPARHLTVLRSA